MELSLFLASALLLAAVAAYDSGVLPGFESPTAHHRPLFRYWLPDASVDIDNVVGDVYALKEVGAGGFQFLPFYNYGFGDPSSPPTSAWDEYGFGTPAFKRVFVKALKTANDLGLRFDFSLGASQGQGAPVEPMTPGLAMQLVYGEASVKGSTVFKGSIPQAHHDFNFLRGYMHDQEDFGSDQLVAVVAAGVKSGRFSPSTLSITMTDSAPLLVVPGQGSLSTVVLDESTLVDLSKSVVNGKLTWKAPSGHNNYTIFALYQRYTNQRSCNGVANPDGPIANGSWITDHFSADGAKLVTQFWEENLLDDDVKRLLQSAGQHTWEDSMEMQASLWWTPDFIKRFKKSRGYDPVKYLPLMFHQSNAFTRYLPPYNTTYALSSADSSQDLYLQDYRKTLNEGYLEYLEAFNAWAASFGMSHSCQVAYNLPLDMSGDVPAVEVPELESLGFTTIDDSLQFVGAAHLSGRNVISTEIGAVQTGAYSQSVPSLVNLFRDAFAGGVNSMMVHGMQYGGEYMATWPGYTPFQYVYGELWSPRQPAWKHMNQIMAYTARNQVVLQAGTAKRDVAFYLYKQPWGSGVFYDGADLRAKGFTHEYLGPTNLASQEATVSGKILAPKGPAYKALVFWNQTYISPEASENVLNFAKQGLPIFFHGGLPKTTIGTAGQKNVTQNMAALLKFSNVKAVKDEKSLVASLQALGVKPRVSVESETSSEKLYSVWRSSGDTQLVYLYNKGPAASYSLTFDVTENKVPFKLNAWTGEQHPLLAYNRSKAGITTSVTLKETQTAVFGFKAQKESVYIVSHSTNIEKLQLERKGQIVALVNDGKSATLTRSDGKKVQTPSLPGEKSLPKFNVGPWDLTIESWVPSSDTSDSHSVIEELRLGPQNTLVPWSKIPAAQNASGIGIYTASFVLPQSTYLKSDQIATLINLGPVLNTLRAWVNGKELPAVDISEAEVDISKFVVKGKNTIKVEVSSTLFNAVKARVDWVKNMGGGPAFPALYTASDWQAYGLTGPVYIRTMRKVSVN
ncbi:hypothetical protein ACJ41O_000197 [Fusarium nematophilum]